MAFHPTVLIVDDEIVSANIYGQALKAKGFSALVCDNADDGLLLAKRYAPRIIISDVQMPGTDGIEFCRSLGNGKLRTGPLIFLTGHDDLSVIRSGLEAGGDDFLAKGLALDAFMQRIYFWIATGFRRLPDAAREKAAGYADRLAKASKASNGAVAPISKAAEIDLDLLKSLAEITVAEVENVGPDFGSRMIERVFFLGRLSHLVLEECGDLSSAIRFPDYLIRATAFVDYPWTKDLHILLSHYDRYSKDPRFLEAARDGLKEVVR